MIVNPQPEATINIAFSKISSCLMTNEQELLERSCVLENIRYNLPHWALQGAGSSVNRPVAWFSHALLLFSFQITFSLPVPGTAVVHDPHKPRGCHPVRGGVGAAIGSWRTWGPSDSRGSMVDSQGPTPFSRSHYNPLLSTLLCFPVPHPLNRGCSLVAQGAVWVACTAGCPWTEGIDFYKLLLRFGMKKYVSL